MTVVLKSPLRIERQARVIGATWLGQPRIGGRLEPGDVGFGADAKQAMQQRHPLLGDHWLLKRRIPVLRDGV